MGGKYSAIARNYDDGFWRDEIQTNNFIKFISVVIYYAFKYDIVDIGLRK